MSDPTVRTLRPDELPGASRVVNIGMLGNISDEVSQSWAEVMDPDLSHGAFAPDGELVGLARWFRTELHVPGGDVRAAAVTAVAVLSTHRRQGHLTRLMRAQLDDVVADRATVATLVAAEWPIYGRYGYGPAIDACRLEVDARSAVFREPPTGRVALVGPAELRPAIEAAHEARRARTPGAISREPVVWDVVAGVRRWPGQPDESAKARGAIWWDDDGRPQGAVAYSVHDVFTRNRPDGRAQVQLLVGATPEAERELWRHLCEIDWVSTVDAGNRGIDDPLPLTLVDGRAVAALDHSDCIWVRLLDLPAFFAVRSSPLGGSSVVEVLDPLGLAAGRWQIELGPDGGSAARTGAAPDLTLPVEVLGAAALGGRSVRRLHEAGWLEEHRAGGVDHLDALLATPTAPWSPTTY